MIERHIKTLLYDYDCVVIPGFGGFITHYVPAEIHPIRHTFLPASKSVAFNEKLKVNDGLLEKYVSQEEKVSIEEAAHLIANFVFELKKQLKEKNRFTFDEVGTLFINHEYRLQFEPENKVNFNNNSFGLPELYCKPISREPSNRIVAINKDRAAIRKALKKNKEQQTESTEESQPTKRPVALWPLIVFPAITVLALGTFILLRDLENKNSLSSLNPFALFSDPVAESAAGPSAQELEQELLGSAKETAATEDTDIELPPMEPVQEESMAEEKQPAANLPKTEEPKQETEKLAPTATTALGNNNKETKEVSSSNQETTSSELPKELPVLKKIEANLNTTPAASSVASNTALDSSPTASLDTKVPVVSSTNNAAPRYYIVSGGFSNRDNAYKLSNELNKKGFNSKVIEPVANTSIYKVTMGEYDNIEEAKTDLNKFKAEQGKDLWIFKY